MTDSELNGQIKDSKVVLMKKQLEETAEYLNQMILDWDVYTNKITYNTLHPVDHTTAGAQSSNKSAKIPDPLLLTDGKES